ncbi:MAG: hypothetical protein JNK15_06685 [Planctomycetes bacterium]|nr:hypothetical protein [Planctomycetota bacterium]
MFALPRTSWHSAFLLLAACATAPVATPPTTDTAAIVTKALDTEALFTVAGGLKPVSEGFWHMSVDVQSPDLAAITATRAALAPWRNDTLWADVHVFHDDRGGKRAARGYVVHRQALAELLHTHAAFFAPFGLGPDTHPAEVFAVVERMPELDRHRGLGLLFGYPEHAIEFFLLAEKEQAAGGKGPQRRFVQIPTHASPTGRFVYAVAADAPELPADRELAAAAAQRLARYRELRAAADTNDADAMLRIAAELAATFAPHATGAR